MNPENLNLPHADAASFVSELQYHPEWRIDPAFLYRLDQVIAHRVIALRMDYLGEVAALQARALNAQSKMYREIAEVLKEQG